MYEESESSSSSGSGSSSSNSSSGEEYESEESSERSEFNLKLYKVQEEEEVSEEEIVPRDQNQDESFYEPVLIDRLSDLKHYTNSLPENMTEKAKVSNSNKEVPAEGKVSKVNDKVVAKS